jgi:hypothetical protein
VAADELERADEVEARALRGDLAEERARACMLGGRPIAEESKSMEAVVESKELARADFPNSKSFVPRPYFNEQAYTLRYGPVSPSYLESSQLLFISCKRDKKQPIGQLHLLSLQTIISFSHAQRRPALLYPYCRLRIRIRRSQPSPNGPRGSLPYLLSPRAPAQREDVSSSFPSSFPLPLAFSYSG